MRYKTAKIVFIVTALCFLFFYVNLTFSDVDPYTNKLELQSAVSKFITALLNQDTDILTALSYMPGTFQFDKEEKIDKFLRNYFDKLQETSQIEVISRDIINSKEAEVTIRVHFSVREAALVGLDVMEIAPRDETWTFVKKKESSLPKEQRGKWLFWLDQLKKPPFVNP